MQRPNAKSRGHNTKGGALSTRPMSAPQLVNDNDEPPAVSIAFTDLAFGMGLDEDALLQRFAAILSRRDAVTVNPPARDEDGG